MQVLSCGGRRPTPPPDSKRGQSPFSGGYLTRLNKPDSPARLRGVMKHQHSMETVNRTKLGAHIPVPLAFLALLLLGSIPKTALGQDSVVYHSPNTQPDDYVIVEPIEGETTIIIQEPEPSWVIVQAAPPAARLEVCPPVPYASAIWVKGYWWWSGISYAWISGHYVRPIRGYHFVAPRWVSYGGYRYHIRGHYRPHGATVRHQPYHHYRRVGYYGHGYGRDAHHSRNRRPTTYRDHDRGHSTHHRGDHAHHRGQDRGRSAHDRHQSTPHRSSTSHRKNPHGRPGHRTSPQHRSTADRSYISSSRPSVHRPSSGRQQGSSRTVRHGSGSPSSRAAAVTRGPNRSAPRRTTAPTRSAKSSRSASVSRGRSDTRHRAGSARTRQ